MMPRTYKLTWQPGNNGRSGRWRKRYKAKTFYFVGGRGKSDRQAYEAALKVWELKKLRIDAAEPRTHQLDYESAIDVWDQVLAWSNRHSDTEMAQLAYKKRNKLRGELESPILGPVQRGDRFEVHFELPRIDLPDDLFEQTAKALAEGRVRFSPTALSLESRRRYAQELDGSPQRIQREIWRDRLESQQRRSAVRQESLEYHIEEYVKQKEQEAESDKLSFGRLYAIRLHLSRFRDLLGKDTVVTEIDSTALRKYHSGLVEKVTGGDWSATTARHYSVTAKAFVRWLWQVEAIPSLPRVLDGKSDVLNISDTAPSIVVYTNEEIRTVLEHATDRTKLFVLLMLNCGMTQKDVSDLLKSEVDWDRGRITRKRSKTATYDTVPTVSYILWSETFRLLELYCDKSGSDRVLLNSNGAPLLSERNDESGKFKKTDNIKNAFDRLKAKLDIAKPLKSFKKSSASRLRDSDRFNGLEDLFLGHAPQKMSDRHYTTPPQGLLDAAIYWLAEQYGLEPPSRE